MQFLPIVDFKRLTLRGEELRRYNGNLQLLARNADVIRMVSESDRDIIELTLKGKNGEEVKVFAKKEGDQVVIYESLFGATRTQTRRPASMDSDFRVHVKPKTFNYLQADPNGVLLESSIYERILYSEEDEFKIFITTEDQSPLFLTVRKKDGDISVKAN